MSDLPGWHNVRPDPQDDESARTCPKCRQQYFPEGGRPCPDCWTEKRRQIAREGDKSLSDTIKDLTSTALMAGRVTAYD